MSGRIRGHYLIEASGRVMPLTDVNAAMKAYSIPLPMVRDRVSERRSWMIRLSMVTLILFSLAVAGIFELPQIQRSILAEQANKMALVRSSFFRNHPEFRSHQRHDRTAEN